MDDNKVRSVLIVGGGTAGWMAAAALAKVAGTQTHSITLVESEEIGTVGVGEATIPAILSYNKLIGLDEDEFVRETHATFKLGIEFVDWRRLNHTYFHNFGLIGAAMKDGVVFTHYWLRWLAAGGNPEVMRFSAEAEAARQGKFGRAAGEGALPNINYAFQFDASRYAAFLRRFSEKRGVVRAEGKIVRVHKHSGNGFIKSVELHDGRVLEADLFIDCSGFRGLLIEGELEAGFEDWSHWLPANRAFAVPCERVEEPTPFTRATAREAGWQWRIPLQHRTGNGYVFSNAFISEDEAASLLLSRLDGAAQTEPRLLRFVAGQRKRSWVKNCVAMGLAGGFLEPLESTSIHLVQVAVTKLLDLFPERDCHPSLAARFNADMDISYSTIRDFIIAHYKVTEREDTPFWAYCKNMSVPDSLEEKFDLFKRRGDVLPSLYDLFREGSWFAVLYGQGLVPESYHPFADAMSEDDLRLNLSKIKAAIDERVAGLPRHEEFLERFRAAPAAEAAAR